MRFSKSNWLNQKKGISSIVGGIFFLVLMTTGFTVYYVALDSQSQMLDTQQIIADNEVAKIKEKFVVAASSSGVNNQLSVQVVNTGNIPVEVADIWIINKTLASEPATKYNDLNFRDVIIPVGYSGDVLENHAPINLIPTIYDIKVVSSLGTIKTVEYDVNGGSNLLSAQMIAIPQDVRFGENVTIALVVTNTGTTETFTDVVGNTNTLSISPNQCENPPNPIFTGPAVLSPSQSIMFFWDCVLLQPIGNTITFTGNATGKLLGVNVDSNDATDSVIVRDFTAGGDGDEIILKDELFGKPEIFMIIPNPFGDQNDGDNERGFWGVNIVNPTNKTMTVNKVSISALRANSNDNIQVFAENCEKNPNPGHMEMISPTTNWTCPNANVLTWKNVGSPITIERQSAFPFLVKLHPDQVVGGNGLETIVVTTSTLTSLGAFGKGPYETAVQAGTEAIANVYLSNNGDSTAGSSARGVVMGILQGSTVQFNATMAELSTSGEAIVGTSGGPNPAELIINLPKEWTNPSVIGGDGFTVGAPIIFADGSTQIRGTLDDNLSNGAKYIEFQVTAPPNTGSNAKMYVIHILATGLTNDSIDPYTVGPIHEAVVQVCPNSGGPPGCP